MCSAFDKYFQADERLCFPGRFFQVPKRLLEQLQTPVADDVEEELLEGDEGTEGVEGQEQQQCASSTAAGGKEPAEEEKWQQFDDLVESWLVRGVGAVRCMLHAPGLCPFGGEPRYGRA